MKNKKVIYTCITGDYDDLKNHTFVNPDWDYVCFTDNPNIKNDENSSWGIRPLLFSDLDEVRNQRWHKLHPHILFPDYEESLWVDGNINIINNGIFDDIELVKTRGGIISIPKHPERSCIYDELEACILYNKDKEEVMKDQINLIKKDGFPRDQGLFETGLIYRKHKDLVIIKIMEDWWHWIKNYSRRDQLSLTYVLWKNNYKVLPLNNISYRDSELSRISFFTNTNHITKEELFGLKEKVEKNNLELRKKIEELSKDLTQKDKFVEEKTKTIERQNLRIIQKDQELDLKNSELSSIYSSRTWKLIVITRKILATLIPVGSRRRKIAGYVFRFAKKVFKILLKIRNFYLKSIALFKKGIIFIKEKGIFAFVKKIIKFFIFKIIFSFKKQKVPEPTTSDIFYSNQDEDKKEFLKIVESLKKKNEINVSVIIPTYNRANLIEKLLERWASILENTHYSCEIIFSDDGSNDITLKILDKYKTLPIVVLKNKHHGASLARNHAINKARGELLIFTGDDIFPEDNFINKHWEYYLIHGQDTVTLGRIEWSSHIEKTHLMKHITEIGCEQFGFIALPKYQNVDFRHFYTSNISVPSVFIKAIGGSFDTSFTKCNFEDIELGYRLSKKGIKIFYAPDIVCYHDHEYNSVDKFCQRQRISGEMLITFINLHPEISSLELGIEIDKIKQDFYSNAKKKMFIPVAVIIICILWIAKKITSILELMIKKSGSNFLKRICSFFYRELFLYYLYLGTTDGIDSRVKIFTRKKIAVVLLIDFNRKSFSQKSLRFLNYLLDEKKPAKNNKKVWIKVETKEKSLIDLYQKISTPFSPSLVVSSQECEDTREYSTYIYKPTSIEKSMDQYGFMNVALCLLNYRLDFVVLDNSLESYINSNISDIESSIIFSKKFSSLREIYKPNGSVIGKIVKIRTKNTVDLGNNMSEIFCKYKISSEGYLYNRSLKIKKNFLSVYSHQEFKKPVIFVFPALMAVGGVERNTIEIISKLNPYFNFIVITWERLTQKSGSLFHQLNPSCLLYFSFAEIIQESSYLDNLKILQKIYNPSIIWVPNSNPWYINNFSKIKEIFNSASMVSQDVYDTENGWITEYKNSKIRQYDRYIAVNEKIKNKFITYGIAENKIDLIYSAINTDGLKKLDTIKYNKNLILKKYCLDPRKKNFAFIGRLVEQKQPKVFLELAKKIIEKYPEINLVMVGDGEQGNEIDLMIKKFNLDKRFIRIKFIESLYEFTKSLDGLIVTSLYEGLPIVTIEAMCLKVPVISTNVGDIPLFVNKYEAGAISNNFDVDGIFDTFQNFYKNLSIYKENLKKHNKNIIETFSSERAAKLMLGSFEKLNNPLKDKFFKDNNSNPLVSVIIPSYNHAPYIMQSVNSVLNQKYKNIELIIIDDGSKDDSVNIIKTIKDPRLILIEQDNMGAHNAINRGLSMAKGEFLTILNSDDVYSLDRIEFFVDILEKEENVDFLCSWIRCIDSNEKSLGVKEGWKNMEPWVIKQKNNDPLLGNNFLNKLILSNFISTTSNMFFRRKVFEELGGMRNLKFVHDWDFAIRVASKFNCKLVESPLINYRLHQTNTIKTNHKNMIFEICLIYAIYITKLSKEIFKLKNNPQNIIQLIESVNMQNNETLILMIIIYLNNLYNNGTLNPEEKLLGSEELKNFFMEYVRD